MCIYEYIYGMHTYIYMGHIDILLDRSNTVEQLMPITNSIHVCICIHSNMHINMWLTYICMYITTYTNR
jgi:hypothetical protein